MIRRILLALSLLPCVALAQTGSGVFTGPPAGLYTTTGALKANGAGVVSSAACADLSNGGTACTANTGISGANLCFLNAASCTFTNGVSALSFTANSGANGIIMQQLSGGGGGALYSTSITPSGTNYSIFLDGANSVVNGTSGVFLRISGTNIASVTSTSVNHSSSIPLTWNSDVGLSRGAAATLNLGNGTQGDASGTLNAAVYQIAGTTQKFPKTFTATYAPASLAPATGRCDSVTVTGITTSGGAVTANPGAAGNALCTIAGVRATGANTVEVCWVNAASAVTACQMGSSTWTFSQPQ